MARSFNSDIDIPVEELTVSYTYHPPFRGARDSFMGRAGAGPQLEPDEPASIEIDSIKVGSVDLDEWLQEKIMQHLNDLHDE